MEIEENLELEAEELDANGQPDRKSDSASESFEHSESDDMETGS